MVKRRAIKEVLCKENPDILVLQEVKKEQLIGLLSEVYGNLGLKNGCYYLPQVSLEVY